MKAKGMLLVMGICFLLLIFNIQLTKANIYENNNDSLFLLADGTIIYHGWDYIRAEAASDTYGIEWVMNISTIENITITSLSDSIVKFEKNYTIIVNEAYQKLDNIIYNPTHFVLFFYDDESNELGSDNSTPMSFSITRHVNKQTGERVLAQNPFGSTEVKLKAYYNSSDVYSRISSNVAYFGEVGSYTNVFEVNASIWEIGSIIRENWTITKTETFQSYDTWKQEYNKIPEGLSVFISEAQYEKTSGLYVKRDYKAIEQDNFYSEEHLWIHNLGGIIDDGYPQVSAPQGKIVNSSDPVAITFIGNDTHYDHHNLYQNGTLYETNTTLEWNFILTPTTGNTTWTFEIIDSLAYSNNASTWLKYIEPEPTTTTPETTTTEITTNETSETTTTSQVGTPGFLLISTVIASIIIILIRRRK